MYFDHVNPYCILFYPFHVSGISTGNKRKKANKDINEKENEDLMGFEAGEKINKTILVLVFFYQKGYISVTKSQRVT